VRITRWISIIVSLIVLISLAVATPPSTAGAKIAPFPTQAQIGTCIKAVTGHKPLTAKQVATCKAAVWQTYIPNPCPKDKTNPLSTDYVAPSGYLIDLGHGYRSIRGKAAPEWAIRAGHKPFLVAHETVTQERIDAAIC
jgi:hypothetical protein